LVRIQYTTIEKEINRGMRRLLLSIIISTATILWAQDSTTYTYKPGDHDLFTQPTAFTMKKGMSHLTSYELLIVGFNHALTDRSSIGLVSLFPITVKAFETTTITFKQNYFLRDDMAAAFWGGYNPKSALYLVGHTMSFRTKGAGFHLGIGYADDTQTDESGELIYTLGFQTRGESRYSFVAEYANSGPVLDDDDISGIINLGVRFADESIVFDFGGFRPFGESGIGASSDLFLFPFVKVTVLYN
jgi:hypothetical protein